MNAKFLFLALFSSAALAAPDTFKMYDQPNAEPNESCDIYTQLKLDVNGDGGTAKLENRVSGGCEIYIAPNPRSYELIGEEDGCGSYIYRDANGEIEITDNRGRLCEDVIPALIVMDEIIGDDAVRTKYSKDN
jgi:hypothetical protein